MSNKFGELGIHDWGGTSWTPVEIVRETKTRYEIRSNVRIKLAGRCRWLEPGQVTLVPKRAVRAVQSRAQQALSEIRELGPKRVRGS